MGPEIFGNYVSAFVLLQTFTTFVAFGIPQSLKTFIPSFRGKKEDSQITHLISFTLKIIVFFSFSSSLLIFIFAPEIADKILNKPQTANNIRLLSFTVAFITCSEFLKGVFIGFKDVRSPTAGIIIEQASRLLIFLILIFFNLNFHPVSISQLSANFIRLLVLLIFFIVQIRPLLPKEKKTIDKRELLGFSGPLYLNNIFLILVNNFDFILLGRLGSLYDVGIYKPAFTLASFIVIFEASIITIALPILAGLVAKEKFDEEKKLYQSISRWLFLINTCITIIILLFPAFWLETLFSPEYAQGASALLILSFGFLAQSFFGTIGIPFQVHRNTKVILVINMIKFSFSLILGLLLIPLLGTVGAAIMIAGGRVLGGIISYLLIRKRYRLQFAPENLITFLIGVVLFFVAKAILGFYNISDSLVSAGLTTLISTLIFFSILIKLKIIRKREVELIKEKAWEKINIITRSQSG